MDKILLIDAHNAMWRASIGFGPPRKHTVCAGVFEEACKHKLFEEGIIHCTCGAKWDIAGCICYGEKYVQTFNFFRNLRPLIEEFSPVKCFFVLEGYPKFRYDLFSDYKANRIIKTAAKQEDRDRFDTSKEEIIKVLQHFPITIARAAHYEADDVIAALCDDMRNEELTILSNDSDYTQLLQRGYKDCQVYNPIKKEFMTAPTYPYVGWKSLNGDKSDNIPALLKPKKALDTINSPELFKKFMEVEENRANFNINRQLIEFHPVPMEEITMTVGVRNDALIKQEFARMEFQSIINDVSWAKYKKTFDCIRY